MRTLVITSSVALLSIGAIGAAAASGTPVYTAKDSGKTVHVVKSHEFKIKLKTSVDGGYTWTFVTKPNSAVVKLVSKHVKSVHPGLPGAEANTIYVFKAVGVGKTTIKLVESQSFTAKSSIAHFSLKEKVTKN